ncbi:MAG: shikimate dehydrogenase [Opitutaceae bacterium]|nr:shikimate dehydrogenase [Opitutaceae bacterium]
MPDDDPLLTLRDLESWSFAGTALGVLGHPIKHSISPQMQNAALAALARTDARFADWRYFRFEIQPDDLPRALALLHAKRFRGVNLTVPHKVIAFGLLDEVDEAAGPAGAVNTLYGPGDGWHGFNTDGYGLASAVRESLGRELGRAPVILLGAGGAARGAAVECLQQGCASLFIINRTRQRLETLLAVLRPLLAGSVNLQGFASDDPRALTSAPPGALVINATSAGLRATDPAPVDLAALPRPAAVLDMIYNPSRTPLLRQAEALGLPGANGLTMLVHQGAKSLEIWSGVPAAQTAPAMLAAARAALGQ